MLRLQSSRISLSPLLASASCLFALNIIAHAAPDPGAKPDLAASPSASAATPAQAAKAETLEGIAAIVNDKLISYSDVRQRARMLLLSLGAQSPTQQQVQQITAQALEQLIDEKLQLQESLKYKVEIKKEEVDNGIEGLARQSGLTREALLKTLKDAGINPTSLEDQTRAELAWRRIMGGLYGSRIRISANQVREQLERLKLSAQKEQYLLGEIFFYAPDPETLEQALKAAKTIREQIQKGAPFQAAAQQLSSSPTAATGGDMGWVSLDTLDATRASAIAAFQGQGITDPISAEDGVYLMAVRGKRSPAEPVSRVDLTRVTVQNGSEKDLKAAVKAMGTCAGIKSVSAKDANIQTADLKDISLDDLGPEGKGMVMATEVSKATDVFAIGGSLAVMFVCKRDESLENMPSDKDIGESLYSQQLGMMSQRSLRNLRREATIVRR